jgi:hypothetical protein
LMHQKLPLPNESVGQLVIATHIDTRYANQGKL